MKKHLGIIGAGRLGKALCTTLLAENYPLSGINDINIDSAKSFAQKIGISFYASIEDLCAKSDVVFLAVPDSIIISLAKEIVEKIKKPIIILQPSGALSAYALPEKKDVFRGSFHPLQSFVSENTSFKNIYIAMDGDVQALDIGKELCAVLSSKALIVPSNDRPLYHAAACMASNYLVTLLSEVESIFSLWANSPTEARQAFWPLVEGTLANYKAFGPKALTGPIARGDTATIETHLQNLPEKYLYLYKSMAEYTIDLAEKECFITKEKSGELKNTLKEKEK